MRWNTSYSVRQPTMPAAIVRKKDFKMKAYGNRNNILADENDFLCHESEDFLQHFGILGMKWGIRRYQNEDGTLTEEGKKRYGQDQEPESKTWKKSDAATLSDEELNRRNRRLQTERQYRDLTTSQAERDRTQLKNEIKKDFLKKALLLPVAGVLAYAGTKFIKDNGVKITDTIKHYSNQKIASFRAAEMLKNFLKKYPNVPDVTIPVRETVGKHVGRTPAFMKYVMGARR